MAPHITLHRHCEEPQATKQSRDLKRFPLDCFARVPRTRNDAKNMTEN